MKTGFLLWTRCCEEAGLISWLVTLVNHVGEVKTNAV